MTEKCLYIINGVVCVCVGGGDFSQGGNVRWKILNGFAAFLNANTRVRERASRTYAYVINANRYLLD